LKACRWVEVVPATHVVDVDVEVLRDLRERIPREHTIENASATGVDEEVLRDDDDWLRRIRRADGEGRRVGNEKHRAASHDLTGRDGVELDDPRWSGLPRLRHLVQGLAELHDVALQRERALVGASQSRLREDGRNLFKAYLFEVKSPAESRSEWDIYKLLSTLSGDDAAVPLSEGKCPLVHA